MRLFSDFFQKARPLGAQPHRDWTWNLSVNGIPASGFGWEDIAQALDSLGPMTTVL